MFNALCPTIERLIFFSSVLGRTAAVAVADKIVDMCVCMGFFICFRNDAYPTKTEEKNEYKKKSSD